MVFTSLKRIARPALAVLLFGCGGATDAPDGAQPRPATIGKLSGDGQVAIASTALAANPTVEVIDSAGRPVAGVLVSFNVVDGDGWVVTSPQVTDAAGRASTTWYVGPVADHEQELEARTGTLSTRFTATSQRPIVGSPVIGQNSYIEWIPGDLPIVLTAPHGGTLLPTDIPDRTVGTTTRDLNTEELARDVAVAFHARTGKRPHLIICRLSRRKLDANREIVEAAAGNPAAERAWREYHGFIEASAAAVRQVQGIGFYIDLHGHGHDIQRLELGYLVSASKLGLSDAQLALDLTIQSSSLWSIAASTGTSIPALLRGQNSLGALLETLGYSSVPSLANPSPGTNPYFDGGYSTQRHGTAADRRFAGVQIESNFDGVRDTPASRAAFAAALARAVDDFMRIHGLGAASSSRTLGMTSRP